MSYMYFDQVSIPPCIIEPQILLSFGGSQLEIRCSLIGDIQTWVMPIMNSALHSAIQPPYKKKIFLEKLQYKSSNKL